MMRRRALLLALSILAAPVSALPALADWAAGSITVSAPWARATPPGARVGGGYFTATNRGDAPDRLLSVRSPAAEKTELHVMKTVDGVMTMRPAADGIAIPPGGSVAFAPDGYHVMFIRPKQPFVAGGSVPLTLVFEKAGTLDVELPILPIGSGGPAAEGSDSMPGMKMDGMAP
jgi:copper(I)-binding protein